MSRGAVSAGRLGVIVLTGALALATGCAGSTSGQSRAAASPTAGGSASATSPRITEALHVVGIGDSFMAAQDAKGRTFLDLYADWLRTSLGRPVELAVLTSGDATSAKVRESLASDDGYSRKVAAADVVVISVGGNDGDPFGVYPAGTCAPGRSLGRCLHVYAPALAGNYEAILSRLSELRAGRPTAVRVTSADNPFVGWSEAPSATFGRDFYAQVAEAETRAMFAAARRHGAQVVDYLHVFGGRDGLHNPAAFLAADHAHPGELGITTIADLLTRLGVPGIDGT